MSILVEIEEGEEEPIPCCVDGKPVEKYVLCFFYINKSISILKLAIHFFSIGYKVCIPIDRVYVFVCVYHV